MRILAGTLLTIVLAGCGADQPAETPQAESSASTPAAPSVAGPLSASTALDIDPETVLAAIKATGVGNYEFAKEEVGARAAWSGKGVDLPLDITVIGTPTSSLERADLIYSVGEKASPESQEQVAKIFGAVASSVIGPDFKEPSLSFFHKCLQGEPAKDVVVEKLKNVEIEYSYTDIVKMHSWTFRSAGAAAK